MFEIKSYNCGGSCSRSVDMDGTIVTLFLAAFLFGFGGAGGGSSYS